VKKIIKTDQAPEPIGPYNQGVLKNDTLYISGQIAVNADSGLQVSGDIHKETEQVMQNLKAILAASNMHFEQVVKATIFLVDMCDFETVNKVYGSYFNQETAPARETVAVRKLPKDARVEISMIAVK
jgi:2-iminobutanoate/2-iminopropanoate deaminase